MLKFLSAVFGWLPRQLGKFTDWLTNAKSHDTKVRMLKQVVQMEIRQACAAAQRGDPCAALQLKALEDSLTEKSVRLTGHKKPPSTVILPPDHPDNPTNIKNQGTKNKPF